MLCQLIKRIVQVHFVRTVFVRIVFVSSTILLQITTKLSIILPAYFPFLQLHVARFQKQPFLHSKKRL